MRFFLILISLIMITCSNETTSEDKTALDKGDYLFVGTYTRTEGHVDGKGKGIHVLQWNSNDQSLSDHMIISGSINPSYIALHPQLPVVYVASELADNTASNIGLVQAYRFDLAKRTSIKISETSSMGDAPCHISLSGDKQHLLVANYVGGSVATFGINTDGSITDALDSFVNEKTTPTTTRQESGHAHMIRPIPKGNSVLVSDLGTDELISFDLNDQGQLNNRKSVITSPNAGPRHFDFHPTLDIVYSLNELVPSISVFQLEYSSPTERLQHLDIPIKKKEDAVFSSAIHVHPSGKAVFAAVRGLNGSEQNEIVGCGVMEDGKLQIIQTISTHGKIPRDFTITPDGNFLIAGNQDSDELVVYSIDQNSFKLKLIRSDQKLPTPVCFKWLSVD